MASVIALRALLGAGLGLGALDLVWINGALAPRLAEHPVAPPLAMAGPQVAVTEPAVPAPAPPVERPAPIAEQPPAPSVEPTAPPATVTERVYFSTNSAELGTRSGKTLERLVAQASPEAMFVLEGHADYRGDESRNKSLSKDRALSVEDRLVRLGVARDRIQVHYVGEDQASSQLWRDRRVEIEITGGTR